MGCTKLKGFCLTNELTNKLKSQPILWFKKEKKKQAIHMGEKVIWKILGTHATQKKEENIRAYKIWAKRIRNYF